MAGLRLRSASGSSSLAPTAVKTAAYTAAVGDIAMMNVAGGATALTLPTAPADKAQVGYRAIGATTAVPLTVTAGGSDTIGTAGATTASVPLADEVVVLQYQAASTRWLGVSNVKTQVSLDGRYASLTEAVNTVSTSGAAQTIPNPAVGGNASISRITLTANCTLTFPTATAGASFTLVLVQDATGGRTVTWPGTVKWAAATAPTLSSGASKVDVLSFVCADGTNWLGFVSGQDMR